MRKSITFKSPSPLPRTRDATEYVLPYAVVDSSLVGTSEERSRTSSFSIRVGGTGSLISCWDFEKADLIKVLFEYGKRHIIQKLKDDALSDKEELLLSTSTAEIPCPFDPSRIPNPTGATIEVDLVGAPIMEDQSFLQLASSIMSGMTHVVPTRPERTTTTSPGTIFDLAIFAWNSGEMKSSPSGSKRLGRTFCDRRNGTPYGTY